MCALRATLGADFSEFSTAIKQVEVQLKTTADYAKNAGRDLNKLVEGFSGSKLFREAELAAEAVSRIGGASRLTETEMRRVNRTVEEAIAKYRALGQEVPAHLEKIAAETKAIGTATQGLGAPMGGFAGMLGKIGPALAATFTVGSVVAFGKELLSTADAIQKMADRTGLTTDQVQRFDHIAGQTGVSLDGMVGAVQNLQQRLGSGDAGAVGALRQLGIAQQDFLRLNPYDQFMSLSSAVGSIEDPTRRAAVAADVFGKSWKELLPAVIADMDALAAAAPVMSDATIKSLDATGDALDKWAKRAKAAVAEVALELAKPLLHGPMGAGTLALAIDWDAIQANIDRQVKKQQQSMASMFAIDERAAKPLEGVLEGLGANLGKVAASADDAARQFNESMRAMNALPTWMKINEAIKGTPPLLEDVGRAVDGIPPALDRMKNAGEEVLAQMARLDSIPDWQKIADAIKGVPPLLEDINAGVEGIPPMLKRVGKEAGESFGAGLEDIAKNFGSLMSDAIINGDWRNAFTALGSQIGELLGQEMGKKLGKSIGGMLGDTLGAILPGIGSMLGPLLSSAFDKLTDAEHRKVNDLRDAWEDQFGSLEDLNKKAQEVGLTLDNYLKADSVEEYTAAITELEAAFAKLDAAAAKYGLTWRDMTAEGLTAGFADQANALLDNFNLLVGAGYDVDKVIAAMADDLNAMLLDAATYGQQLPAAMQPMVDKLVELGLISDEVAAALTGNADAVTAASQQATAAMQAQFDALGKEYDSLAQSIADEAPEEVMGVVETQTRARMAAIQEEQDALQASMDAAQQEAQTTAEELAQALKDIFADPVKVNIDWGEPPDWWEEIHGGVTGNAGKPGGAEPNVPGYAQGTGGFVNFGAGTLAMLHGYEAVVPLNNAASGGRRIEITLNLTSTTNLDGKEVARNQVRYLPNQLALAGV